MKFFDQFSTFTDHQCNTHKKHPKLPPVYVPCLNENQKNSFQELTWKKIYLWTGKCTQESAKEHLNNNIYDTQWKVKNTLPKPKKKQLI